MKEKIAQAKLKKIFAGNELPNEIYDTEITGFSLRLGKTKNSFRLQYYNQAGEKKQLVIGHYPAITAEVARKAAIKTLAEVKLGNDPQEQRKELREKAKRVKQETGLAYLNTTYTGTLKRRKTGQETESLIRRSFSSLLEKPMSTIKRADIAAWQNQQESKGLKHATVKRHYGAFNAMLNHAVSMEVIDSNPLKGFKLEAPALTEEELTEGGGKRRYLSSNEVHLLFSGLDQYQEEKRVQRRNSRAHGKPNLQDLDSVEFVDYVKPFVLMAYYTGFRSGDLFGLRWEHVSLSFKTIRKVIEKTAHHESGKEPMNFPIADQAIDALETWWQQQGNPENGYVFPSTVKKPAGQRMDKGAMQKPWRKIKELSGLPKELHLYSLRHNFASQLVLSDVDLFTVSKLMGHKDIDTTIKNYAHLKPDKARECVNAFANQVSHKEPTNLNQAQQA